MFSVRRPGNWGEVKELLTSLPDDGAMLMEHIYASHMVYVAFLKTAQGYFFVATYLKNSYMSYREWDWLQCYTLLVLYGVSPLGTENLSTKDHQSSPSSLFFYSFIHTSERKWQICWLNIRGISWTSMNKPKGSPPKNTIKITSRIIPMTPFYMNRLCSCWVTPSF